MKSQEDLVLCYLKSHKGGMTSLVAFERYGIIQMPRRVFNLRKRGWKISSTPKTGKNRWGKSVRYVVYRLEAA